MKTRKSQGPIRWDWLLFIALASFSGRQHPMQFEVSYSSSPMTGRSQAVCS